MSYSVQIEMPCRLAGVYNNSIDDLWSWLIEHHLQFKYCIIRDNYVYDIEECEGTDAIAIKLMFPSCTVRLQEHLL